MVAADGADGAPEPFRRALASLRAVSVRPEVSMEEAPAPQRLAPYAVALTADVNVGGEEIGTGRLVLLHDPEGHETWRGTFRLVTYVRAELEPEMGADPLLPGVGWAWLMESLESRAAVYGEPSGTVTRVSSESFGTMEARPATADIEIRASWTPLPGPGEDVPEMSRHVEAWCELLCASAGLPPVPAGVAVLPTRPRGRNRLLPRRSRPGARRWLVDNCYSRPPHAPMKVV